MILILCLLSTFSNQVVPRLTLFVVIRIVIADKPNHATINSIMSLFNHGDHTAAATAYSRFY